MKLIDNECRDIEKETQKKIETFVNKHKNIVVDAGAGSGKTYSLIELLRSLIEENRQEFSYTNQKIMCITYTNAATDEIKERLGESSLVAVSTIHERVWDIIKIYQKQLREIHIAKVKSTRDYYKEKLNGNEFYQQYKDSPKYKKFLEFLHKDLYQNYWNLQDSSATEIHKEVGGCFTKNELNRNSGRLKDMTRYYYNYYRYQTILAQDLEGKEITYNFLSNRDNFLKFEISHDTVLEYGLELIKKDEIFKKIVIDRFPFVVIDEYQDVENDVLEMIMHLNEYAKERNLPFTVALFGDELQSIYDNNYSKQVKKYFFESDNFNKIPKKFNYRSSKKIIEVGNRIRTDGIKQKSPYINMELGSVDYKEINNDNFIIELNEIKEKWNINRKNKLNCLILRNKDIAYRLGIENIYNTIEKMKYYSSGTNYKLVAQHILSRDRIRLGKVQVVFLNILDLYMQVNQKNIFVSDILPEKHLKRLTIQQANNYVSNLKNNFSEEFKTFREYLDVFFEGYRNASDETLKKTYEKYNTEQFKDANEFKNFIKESFKEEDDENVDKLYNIGLREYIDWYSYLYNNGTHGEIEYQTYHNTKGLEFENVVIVMTNQMRNRKDYFEYYLKNRENWESLIDEDLNKKFIPARNLLYVATTRAIKNLQIWYVDDIEAVEKELAAIFSDSN